MIFEVFYKTGMFGIFSFIITIICPYLVYKAFKIDFESSIKFNFINFMSIFLGIIILSSYTNFIEKNVIFEMIKYCVIPLIAMLICIPNIIIIMQRKKK